MFSFRYPTYLTTLLVAEFILFGKAKHRPHFVWRLILSLIVAFLSAGGFDCIPAPESVVLQTWLSFFCFMGVFLLSIGVMRTCYDEKWLFITDNCLISYAIQHIASRFVSLTIEYWQPLGSNNDFNLNWVILCLLIHPVIYLIAIYLIKRVRKQVGDVDDWRVTAAAIPLLIATFFISRMDTLFGLPNSHLSDIFYPIVLCISTLLLQTGVLSNNKKDEELALTEGMLEKERQKYQSWEQSINLINLKCHDLKYMLRDYREHQSDEKLNDIEKAIMIYDGAEKTGNETLDLLLFEKSEECTQKSIEFTYLVDGKLLDFISKENLLVLFGNILDNAIEGVQGLEEKKRVINLKVLAKNGLILIEEENYAREDIQFVEGLPTTNKGDKSIHGFGTRSIKLLVEEYHGILSYSCEKGIFKCQIAIPSPLTK